MVGAGKPKESGGVNSKSSKTAWVMKHPAFSVVPGVARLVFGILVSVLLVLPPHPANIASAQTAPTATATPVPQTCPCTIWPSSATPAVADANDSGAIELGVKFQTDTSGYILGVRFYKGSANTGTHVGNLWSNTGALLATATFSGETASGWQQVNFSSPVAVTANTTYVASYHTSVGEYAYTGGTFATAGVDNAPLHALSNAAANGNGLYLYSAASAFPTQNYNATNYWVDALFNTAPKNPNPPVISNVGAVATSSGTVTFSWSTNEGANSQVDYGVTASYGYSTAIDTNLVLAHSQQIVGLPPNTTYHYRVKSTDQYGNSTVSGDYTVTTPAATPSPNQGPGGPILAISSAANPFSLYYAEILRAEGLNEFTVTDISAVSSTVLNSYDVVILGDMALTAGQATMLSNWVTAGGNLIAMHPDKQLAGLLGLTSTSNTLSNAYLLVNTASGPGAGIVNQTMQFHGSADLYALNGASAVATLYSNATTSTPNPAVTLNTVGTNGGKAAAFTYDLARSIVYTRQGDPAWTGQHRDGLTVVRSDDQYYGAASNDPQADWVDLNKVSIPQADEQQRLLANLITEMNQTKKPLPRFWYLPSGLKAAVVMTGDDHANGGTAGRWDQYIADSPPGCNVADWQCIRGTSYLFPGSPLTDAQAKQYTAQGFEVGLHVNTGCADWTPPDLNSFFSQQLTAWSASYPSEPAPITERLHCVAWSDWSTVAQTELSYGIRLDTTYYYYPPAWMASNPGFMTGSAMPMRITNSDGSMVDVYEAATQLTDESGQTYPDAINSVLNNALGALGFYGVFTVNAHTDSAASSVSDAVVAAAQANHVPVVSAKQMLTWIDGRNNSSYSNITWGNNSLSFSVTQATGANNLQGMVPTSSNGLLLAGISENGAAIGYTTETIKGIEYAFFPATTGSYQAAYLANTTPPTISHVTASAITYLGATVAWNTDEVADSQVDYGTTTAYGTSTTLDTTLVASHSQQLTSLTPSTLYHYRVRSHNAAGVATVSGDYTFTTAPPPPCPCTIWSSTAKPVTASSGDASGIEVGVKFQTDISGYISGIRFYKGSSNTGPHTGDLWSSSGALLATATFTGETASGWQQVTFSTPVAVTANTTYVAAYYAPSGNYAEDDNSFTAALNNPPLHVLASGTSGGNGVYAYGAASTFPNQTYNAANYWVDVVFTTSIPTTPTPTITPTPTVGPSPTATTTPTSTPTVGPSPTPHSCPCTIWPSSATPVTPATSDPSAVEVGVKFQADSSGFISGIRFYKGSTNTGPHSGDLWSSSGALLATATFSGETASGWQQVSFSSPVAITANTTYVAAYHTSSGNYAEDDNSFTAALNNPPLHVLASGTSGGNGVYAYGAASTFPNQTYNAANYWVDVVFTTAGGSATATPTATSTATATPTATSTAGPTATATSTAGPTATPTATNTAGPTATATATNTAGPTATATNTPVATATSTPTPTATATATPTKTPTATATP